MLVSVQDPRTTHPSARRTAQDTRRRGNVSLWAGAWGVRGHQDCASRGNEWEGSWEPAPRQLQGAAQCAAGTQDWRQGRPSREPTRSVCCGVSAAPAARPWGELEPTSHAGWCGVGYGQESWGAQAPPGSPLARVPESPLSRSLCSGAGPASPAEQRQPGAQRSACRHVPDNKNKAKHTPAVPAAWLSVQVQGWDGSVRASAASAAGDGAGPGHQCCPLPRFFRR